jgi:AcrR family transcriptional regulator
MTTPKPRRRASAPPPVAERGTSATRERILEAAAELFGARGPHGVSLREIVDGARVNIAAVNYHFGSKDELFDIVVAQSIGHLADALSSSLADALREHGKAMRLEHVLAAYLHGGLKAPLRTYLRLRTWMALGDPQRAAELLAIHFDPIARQYIGALERTLPKMSRVDVGWRLYLTTAALLFTAFDANRLERLTEGETRSTDVDTVVAHLVPLLIDGIATPSKKLSAVSRAKKRGGPR